MAAIDTKKIFETVVIDAGGRYGMHPTWKGFSGELRYFIFEPDPDEAARLADKYERDGRIKVEPYALSDQPGEVSMRVLSHHGQSSLFTPNLASNWFGKTRVGEGEMLSQYQVRATTIDEYCLTHRLAPDFLKSDTEGSEMLVLRGAGQCLDRLLGLRCETQFESVFLGAPTFADIFMYLTQRGFMLLNLDYAGRGSPCNKFYAGDRYGILTGSDAVWVRKPEEIMAWEGNEVKKMARSAKYAIFCFANGATDLAMHMILLARQNLGSSMEVLTGTKLLASLDLAVQRLFYQLLQHPAYARAELEDIYVSLFARPLKRCHEFFESNEFNPT